MAIGTDAGIDFFGTRDSLNNTSAAVADDAFSNGTSDLLAWTNDDDAPRAVAVLTFQYPSGTLVANPSVFLYARLIDIDAGDVDAGVPDANYPHRLMGVFYFDTDLAAVTDVSDGIILRLPNMKSSQIYHFYTRNKLGVQMSAGWDLEITPKAIGPHG